MKLQLIISSLLLVHVCHSMSREQKSLIESAANDIETVAPRSEGEIELLRKVAFYLQDPFAQSALLEKPESQKFSQGLISLLSDLNRAMWVEYDDKRAQAYMNSIADRMRLSYGLAGSPLV